MTQTQITWKEVAFAVAFLASFLVASCGVVVEPLADDYVVAVSKSAYLDCLLDMKIQNAGDFERDPRQTIQMVGEVEYDAMGKISVQPIASVSNLTKDEQ